MTEMLSGPQLRALGVLLEVDALPFSEALRRVRKARVAARTWQSLHRLGHTHQPLERKDDGDERLYARLRITDSGRRALAVAKGET